MSLILRKNNLCGRMRRARKMLNLDDDEDYVANVAAAQANAHVQQEPGMGMASATGAGTGLASASGAGGGFDGFHHQQQDVNAYGGRSHISNNNTITSNQINKYLMDQQGQSSQPTNFFPTQNPSYAAQPSTSTGMMQHQHQQDSTSSNNAEQLLQQLLQQQVELQNQINAQMQLNASTNSTNNAYIQAHQAHQAQQAQLSSSAGYHLPARALPHHQQPGDSDLMNVWQQIGSDIGNLDSATAVNSNHYITTPGIASFLAGNESLGAVAARTGALTTAGWIQQQQQQLQQPPMATNSSQELARFPTGALGAAGASSLFGGNAGWSSANNVSSLAAQANANIMANLHGGSNAAATGGDNSNSNSAAAAASGLDMLNNRRGSGSDRSTASK